MTKIQNNDVNALISEKQCPPMFGVFDYWYFDIVSKFEFRASDFKRNLTDSPA